MKKNDIIILGLLLEKNRYGYDILNTIKERSINKWAKLSISSIYKTLEKLRKRKLVEVKKEKIGNTPQRNIYNITEKGKIELEKLLKKSLSRLFYQENPFYITLSFIYGLEKKEAVKFLKARLNIIEETIFIMKNVYNKRKSTIPTNWVYVIEGLIYEKIIERKLIRKMQKSYEDGTFSISYETTKKYLYEYE